MNIPTSKLLTDFSGETLKAGDKDLTLGEALANILLSASEGGKMKLYSLAEKASKSKTTLDVDHADLALIKTSVENDRAYPNNLIAGQILAILEDVKESKKDAG